MNTQKKYLELLQKQFPSENQVITEIINLKAILDLPKGTEHFVSDLHGESKGFQHVLRNGSGNIQEKIKVCFKQILSEQEMNEFASLIYYPEEKLTQIENSFLKQADWQAWQLTTIKHLITLVRFTSSKYTRSKVRKALPEKFSYIIEELLYPIDENQDKKSYYHEILAEILRLQQATSLIIGLSYTIQRLVVDHLHVVGDIYDRGPEPDKIIDALINYHSVDVQWGNHDVIWIGAASGSALCMMSVLRISARYNNLDLIEDVYGINLRPLLNYAEKYYEDNSAFHPKTEQTKHPLSELEKLQITKIHQAVAILQFKLETALIKRRPDFKMEHRLSLEFVDYEKETITLKGKKYDLKNTCFTTITPHAPASLTNEEEELIQKLLLAFQQSEKLKKHIDFLMAKGSLALNYNENLLIHGCVPLNEDGSFMNLEIARKKYGGKKLFSLFEKNLRECYAHPEIQKDFATDSVWYLWSGECSSLFGKKEMTTFERYFIKEKETHFEEKNPYYQLRNDETVCEMILTEFGLNPDDSHIINGHTPIKEINGENPIKANGKMIVIDGGFSKAYQPTTGIAGYTLLYNSYGIQLVAHQPFSSIEKTIVEDTSIVSSKRIVDRPLQRKKVSETTTGKVLQIEVEDLEILLEYLRKQKKLY